MNPLESMPASDVAAAVSHIEYGTRVFLRNGRAFTFNPDVMTWIELDPVPGTEAARIAGRDRG